MRMPFFPINTLLPFLSLTSTVAYRPQVLPSTVAWTTNILVAGPVGSTFNSRRNLKDLPGAKSRAVQATVWPDTSG